LIEKLGLLDVVAEQHRTFISNLRLLPELKWAALGDLYRLPDKERYPSFAAFHEGRFSSQQAGLLCPVLQAILTFRQITSLAGKRLLR